MQLSRRHPGRHAGPRAPRGRADYAGLLLALDRPARPMRSHLGHAGVRMLARTLVAAVVLVGLANLPPPTALPTGPPTAGSASPAQMQLMKRFDCSPDGFGDGSTPRSAIIRRESGLDVVSFDRGWEVYTGTRPHALVALCLDPPR